MPRPIRLLQAAAALWAAVLGGFFWAYSVSVAPGLALAEPSAAMQAMQTINVAVRNPGFALGYFGAVVLCLALLAVAIRPRWRAPWPALLGAGLLLLGAIAVTSFGNMPLNRALALQDPGAPDAALRMAGYLADWSPLNNVRMIACLLSAALLIGSLMRPHGPPARG